MRWILALLTLALGCASTRTLSLPEGAQADRYSVGGYLTALQRKVLFGPYTVRGHIYASGLRKEPSIFNGWTETDETRHRAKLELATASGTYRARCERLQATRIEHEHSLGYERRNGEGGWHVRDEAHLKASALLYGCVIGQPGGGELRLSLHDGNAGVVEGQGVHLSVIPLSDLDDAPSLAAGLDYGFVISDDDAVLAVVDVSERGSVTLLRTAGRDQLAAVAAALLMLRQM